MPVSPCPSWCVTRHGVHLGEENWVHTGEPLLVADGIPAYVVMSVDPETGTSDGPYVLIGAREYTLSEARHVGSALMAAVDSACATPAGGPECE
ncbi:hypothetical protein [Knoellia sp. Soil729]|uniref:hypothetical protein n=1 Tax=Knoellia sp. Soil729 TaxID=1736394 RepID=UPI0012E85588|nr:hypothetical protein [Knoellia sp. Soil729]